MTTQYAPRANPILITGANRGLGLSVAKSLSRLGQSTVLIGRNKDSLHQAIVDNEITKSKEIVFDLSKDSAASLDRHLGECGPISGMIHCASMFGGSLTKSDLAELEGWGRLFSNTLMLSKACLTLMKGQGGRMVFVGSVAGSAGRVSEDYGPYSVYKGSLRLLAEAVTKEGLGHRVTASYLNLGSFRKDDVALEKPARFISESDVVDAILGLVYTQLDVRIDQVDVLPTDEA